MRTIAENYGYTPQQVADLTWDQVWVLCVDESQLKMRRTEKVSVDHLRDMGLLPSIEDLQRQERRAKRARRRMRLQKLAQHRNKGAN